MEMARLRLRLVHDAEGGAAAVGRAAKNFLGFVRLGCISILLSHF